MKLKDWREKAKRSQRSVADDLNRMAEAEGDPDRLSQASVDRWEKGTIPRQENMRRLMKLTDNVVTFSDFYGDRRPKRRPRDPAVSVEASRKAAASVRRAREARPLGRPT